MRLAKEQPKLLRKIGQIIERIGQWLDENVFNRALNDAEAREFISDRKALATMREMVFRGIESIDAGEGQKKAGSASPTELNYKETAQKHSHGEGYTDIEVKAYNADGEEVANAYVIVNSGKTENVFEDEYDADSESNTQYEGETLVDWIEVTAEKNRGTGTTFLKWLANRFDDIVLAPNNEDARRLYERLGTEIEGDDWNRFSPDLAYSDQGYGMYEIRGGWNDQKFSLKGMNEHGDEVYETSEEVKALSMAQRLELFKEKFENTYIGKTVEFYINGKRRTAEIDKSTKKENLNAAFGGNQVNKALAKLGADGDFITLLENSRYDRRKYERNTGAPKNYAHKDVKTWDYFQKRIVVDGRAFDVVINIRNKDNGSYVYKVSLNGNKKRPGIANSYKADRPYGIQADAHKAPSDRKTIIPPAGEKTTPKAKFSLKTPIEETRERGELAAIQSIERKSINDFTDEDIKKTATYAQKLYKELGVKSPFFRAWFGDWRANDKTPVAIANKKGDTRGRTRNDDTGWDINISSKIFNETASHTMKANVNAVRYLPYINDIVKKAVLLDSFSVGGRAKSPNTLLMHSLYAIADTGNGRELLKLYVEEMNDPNAAKTAKRAYQLQNIESRQLSAKGSGVSRSPVFSTTDIKTISDLFEAVKSKDESFNPKPASQVVGGDGRPLVVYHHSGNKFNEFDRSRARTSMDIDGFFFAPENDPYNEYGENVISAYLNIKSPAINPKWEYGVTYNAGTQERLRLQKQGYDGVINKEADGTIYEYMAFEPNQIKSADKNRGTFNAATGDIRYSRAAQMTLKSGGGLCYNRQKRFLRYLNEQRSEK